MSNTSSESNTKTQTQMDDVVDDVVNDDDSDDLDASIKVTMDDNDDSGESAETNASTDKDTDKDKDNDDDAPQLTTRQKVVVASSAFILFLQVVLSKGGSTYTPSYLLSTTANKTLGMFSLGGFQIVNASKALAEYISIKDVAMAVYDLLTPIGYLLLSPYYIFSGIIENVMMDKASTLIGLGTAFSLSAILFLIAERRSINALKPSNVLSVMYRYGGRFYEIVGRIAADMSSVYRVLSLDRVVDDAIKICDPALKLVTVPSRAIYGYVKEIEIGTFSKARVILAGTLTITGLFAYGYMLRSH